MVRAYCCVSIVLWVAPWLHAIDFDTYRTWTSLDGRTMRAKVLSYAKERRSARFLLDDGRQATVALSRLSDEDQELFTSYLEAAEPIQGDGESTKSGAADVEIPRRLELKRVPMVRQHGNFCVPASATMIAGYHDVETDQDQVAKLSSEGSASNQGTYPRDMLLAMEKLGFAGQMLHWQGVDDFTAHALPAICKSLVEFGPVYISFKPGVFGEMGHGCVIVGYDNRKEEMQFHNPWGNKFEKEYIEVAEQGYGVVFIEPPQALPIASEVLIGRVKQALPVFSGSILTAGSTLAEHGVGVDLIWCNRYDRRHDSDFAEDTAREDGRKILKLAFRRNPAVLIPMSPNGETKKYLFVTYPQEGGARYLVREIGPDGWGEAELKTLGSLTREWATYLKMPRSSQSVWELPLLELSE